jgi:small subunit ribosomal protein S3
MGHKVNPIGLRVGINRTWDSRWFASRGEYGRLLHEDMRIRDHILKQRRQGGISKVVIERPHKKCRVTVHTARPGVLIGKKGADIEKLRGELAKLRSPRCISASSGAPEIDAVLVAETIAQQLERRVAFRRAMKRAVQSAIRLGALGIRISCSGQLGGARSRAWVVSRGRVPLHAACRYRFRLRPGQTAYGVGVSVDLQGRDHGARSDGRRERALESTRGGGGPSPRWRGWRRARWRMTGGGRQAEPAKA